MLMHIPDIDLARGQAKLHRMGATIETECLKYTSLVIQHNVVAAPQGGLLECHLIRIIRERRANSYPLQKFEKYP